MSEAIHRTPEQALARRSKQLVLDARRVRLTPTEERYMVLIPEGLTIERMSQINGVSEWTGRYHINNILEKFQARSRAHLVAICFRAGRMT